MRIAECGLRNEKQGGIRDADCESPAPNSELRTPHLNGFTLIEIVIVIVIIGIISTVAAMIITRAVKMYSDENARSDIHYQARLAVERVAREARLIRSCTDITLPGVNPFGTAVTPLAFNDINGNAVSFSVAGGNLSRGGNILASGITSATPFRFLDNAGNPATACPGIWFVEINVTDTQGANSLQIRTRVHPRNF